MATGKNGELDSDIPIQIFYFMSSFSLMFYSFNTHHIYSNIDIIIIHEVYISEIKYKNKI